MLFQKRKLNNYVQPPPSCQCFYQQHAPENDKRLPIEYSSWQTVRGSQLFFTPTKKRPQLMISGALNKKREKRLEGNNPMSRKENCWVSHLCFSSLQLDLQLIYLSGVAPWIPRIPGFTTRLWWMKSAAGWEVSGDLIGFNKPSKIATPTRISRYHNNRLGLN